MKKKQQGIGRRTFRSIFEEFDSMIIPVFQRRYCWGEEELTRWWNDLSRMIQSPLPISSSHDPQENNISTNDSKDNDLSLANQINGSKNEATNKVQGLRDIPINQGLSVHNVNSVRIKVMKNSDEMTECLVIDGQQRLTTTCLLLAAVVKTGISLQASVKDENDIREQLHDNIKELKNSFFFKQLGEVLQHLDWLNLVDHLEKLIMKPFSEPLEQKKAVASVRMVPKLTPSHGDRADFSSVLCATFYGGDMTDNLAGSAVLAAFNFLKQKLIESLTIDVNDIKLQKSAVTWLIEVVRVQLDLMCPMLVKLDEREDLGKLFQKYQQQTIMGLASFLKGIPGKGFVALDMVRNHVMALFSDLPVKIQGKLGIKFEDTYWCHGKIYHTDMVKHTKAPWGFVQAHDLEELYSELWLCRIENKLGSRSESDDVLNSFLEARGYHEVEPNVSTSSTLRSEQDGSELGRWSSEFEKSINQKRSWRMKLKIDELLEDSESEEDVNNSEFVNSIIQSVQDEMRPLEIFARFVSYFEALEAAFSGETEMKNVEDASLTDKVRLFGDQLETYLKDHIRS